METITKKDITIKMALNEDRSVNKNKMLEIQFHSFPEHNTRAYPSAEPGTATTIGHQFAYAESILNFEKTFDKKMKTSKLDTAKKICAKMHQLHAFPENYFKTISNQSFPSLGEFKDQEYADLQKRLMEHLNEFGIDKRNEIDREIRKLIYSK